MKLRAGRPVRSLRQHSKGKVKRACTIGSKFYILSSNLSLELQAHIYISPFEPLLGGLMGILYQHVQNRVLGFPSDLLLSQSSPFRLNPPSIKLFSAKLEVILFSLFPSFAPTNLYTSNPLPNQASTSSKHGPLLPTASFQPLSPLDHSSALLTHWSSGPCLLSPCNSPFSKKSA